MRFFIMHVERDNGGSDRSHGHVSCWINDDVREVALGKAMQQIEAQSWTVLNIIEDYEIRRDDYESHSEGLKYFEQALVDGEVRVFFVVGDDM